MSIRVALEVAPKRSFASALDWPGWSRGGRNEDEALDALLAYAPRYAAVAKRAKLAFRPPATTRGLDVVERIKGDGGTEFGVPGKPAASEDEPALGGRPAAAARPSPGVLDRLRRGSQEGGRGRADEGSPRRRARAAEDHRARPRGGGRLSRPARITSSRGRGRDRRQTDGPAAPRLCRGAHRGRHRPAAGQSAKHQEALDAALHGSSIRVARPRPRVGDRGPQPADRRSARSACVSDEPIGGIRAYPRRVRIASRSKIQLPTTRATPTRNATTRSPSRTCSMVNDA